MSEGTDAGTRGPFGSDDALARLEGLLERSSERSIEVVQGCRDDIKQIRADLRVDRERDDRRLDGIEKRLASIERRSAVLVDEHEENGQTVVTAKPATFGIDFKTGVGLILAFATAVVVPIVVALLHG